jgi:sulfatase maturation enzyme AslB (radical SAM superfamily)
MQDKERHNYRPVDLYYQHITKSNNSWCPLPWAQVAVHNSGEYRSCIQARSCKKTRGILKDKDNNIMRAETNSIDEIRNAPLLAEVRKNMLDGKRHSMCIRCNNEDDAKMNSRRRNAIREYYLKYNYDIFDAESSTQPDGTIVTSKAPVLEWDIRLGNLCNLRCRMCHPSESTQWYDEWFDTMFTGFKTDFTQLEFEKTKGKAKLKNDIFSWYEKGNFFEQFDNSSNGTRKIYFSGGEPTLVENMYDMLQKLIDSGMAKDMELEYNINLTNIPRRAIDLWHKFKKVQLGCSVDGVGKINDYIRSPCKWNKIDENIKWLDANTKPNIVLFNTFTWQILNAVEVFDLVKYQIENNFTKFNSAVNSVFFSMHFLHSPDYLNVKALPKELKEYVQHEFDKFDNEWFKPWVDNLPDKARVLGHKFKQKELLIEPEIPIFQWMFPLPKKYTTRDKFNERDNWNKDGVWYGTKRKFYQKWKNKMQSMLDFMWSEDKSQHFPKFVKRMKTQDKYRNENFDKLYPEISSYIRKNFKNEL